MEICFIAINYPSEKRKIHIFLDNVVRTLTDRGVHCRVIAPQSSFSFFFKPSRRRALTSDRKTENGNSYRVFSPLYTVFPKIRLGKICLEDQSKYSFYRAVKKTYEKNSLRADALYAHFLQAGIPAVLLGREKSIPTFIANGEADTLASVRQISRGLIQKTLQGAAGIISVSQKCRDEIFMLCEGEATIMNKTVVIPNAADSKRFFPMDQAVCRRELGMPEHAFITAFTGSFISRKGVRKVAAAIDASDGVWGIFIGAGPEKPVCRNILFCGTLENEKIARYLNAADVFVLPTLAEGCPNAVVEAMACGLPILSSDRPFNQDILDGSCAILVDPEDQEQITGAIQRLRDNPAERDRLKKGSLEKAQALSLEKRADRILAFIRQNL